MQERGGGGKGKGRKGEGNEGEDVLAPTIEVLFNQNFKITKIELQVYENFYLDPQMIFDTYPVS